jgi:hypothetical protein
MIALDPILQLAGLIAGVFAQFEHGDDNDFDGNGLWLRGAWDGTGCKQGVVEEDSKTGHF